MVTLRWSVGRHHSLPHRLVRLSYASSLKRLCNHGNPVYDQRCAQKRLLLWGSAAWGHRGRIFGLSQMKTEFTNHSTSISPSNPETTTKG